MTLNQRFGWIIILVFCSLPSSWAGIVSVHQMSPTTATVTSPFQVSASASTTRGVITGWHVYYNGNMSALGSGSGILNGSLSLPPGTYDLVTRAWDSTGAYNSCEMSVTVVGTNEAFDPYPANAVVLSNLEELPWIDWGGCGPGCGSPIVHSMAKTATALTDPALEFNVSDSSGAFMGDLYYHKLASTNASNWIIDYYVYLNIPSDIVPSQGIVALEMDANQTGSKGDFVFGTESTYGYGAGHPGQSIWSFWSGPAGAEHWVRTSIPNPITKAKHWYHVQMHFVVLDKSQYQMARLKVTDTTTGTVVQDQANLGTFNSVTGNSGHGDAVDFQLDVKDHSFSAIANKYTVIRW